MCLPYLKVLIYLLEAFYCGTQRVKLLSFFAFITMIYDASSFLNLHVVTSCYRHNNLPMNYYSVVTIYNGTYEDTP